MAWFTKVHDEFLLTFPIGSTLEESVREAQKAQNEVTKHGNVDENFWQKATLLGAIQLSNTSVSLRYTLRPKRGLVRLTAEEVKKLVVLKSSTVQGDQISLVTRLRGEPCGSETTTAVPFSEENEWVVRAGIMASEHGFTILLTIIGDRAREVRVDEDYLEAYPE